MRDFGDYTVTAATVSLLFTLGCIIRQALEHNKHGIAAVYFFTGIEVTRWLLVRVGTSGASELINTSGPWVQVIADDSVVTLTHVAWSVAAIFAFFFDRHFEQFTSRILRDKEDTIEEMQAHCTCDECVDASK